jgi:hypothetical protein
MWHDGQSSDRPEAMTLRIPDDLAVKTYTFPESSYGAITVILVLSDGTRIHDVVLGGDYIVKVQGRRVFTAGDLDFRISEIVDVLPASRSSWMMLIAEGLMRAIRATFKK